MKIYISGFQSTHPLRGATAIHNPVGQPYGISIHAPLAGCDFRAVPTIRAAGISIHAPLAGCDCAPQPRPKPQPISIHAPLAGCDEADGLMSAADKVFQSTHPLRGATLVIGISTAGDRISIHAPLAGCDPPLPPRGGGERRNFNPRTPCGVRR